MTPELERLVEEFNNKAELLGWKIDTLINIATQEKIGGSQIPPKKDEK